MMAGPDPGFWNVLVSQAGFFEFIGMVASGIIGALGALIVVHNSAKADRANANRELYARAFRCVTDWRELPFRKLRCRTVEVELVKLRERFHTLQEEFQFNRGWIASGSESLAHSYERLFVTTKKLTAPILQALDTNEYSKQDLIRDMAQIEDQLRTAEEEFLEDVRTQGKTVRARCKHRNRKAAK